MNDKQRIENVTSLEQLPLILALNKNAEPIAWINYKRCAFYYAKKNVLWSLGQYEVMLHGGTNARTGKRSTLIMDSIIGIDNDKSPFSYKKSVPTLSNKSLFERDRGMCAYCGNIFKNKELTCDHVIPRSKGGKDIWENVVAACKPCNSLKDDMLLAEANMELLYLPYQPNYHESMILKNRKLLQDQMEFLMRGVHKNSRLRETVQ